jgi:hypothetical protein
MRLIDYMRAEQLDDVQFAELYNDGLPKHRRCTEYAVKKWKYGERTPGADTIIRIETITHSNVRLRDWASDRAEVS